MVCNSRLTVHHENLLGALNATGLVVGTVFGDLGRSQLLGGGGSGDFTLVSSHVPRTIIVRLDAVNLKILGLTC